MRVLALEGYCAYWSAKISEETLMVKHAKKLGMVKTATDAGSAMHLASVLRAFENVLYSTETNNLGHAWFNVFGYLLRDRYDRLGEVDDINRAVKMRQRAVDLVPEDHVEDFLEGLSGLGNVLRRRYDRLGDVRDLERAVSTQERAVELTPDGHPDKPIRLGNLGITLRNRYGRSGDQVDLSRAISLYERAIQLATDYHPDKPQWLGNLGVALRTRFECSGDTSDLEIALTVQRRAVELTPDAHPKKSARLGNLGNTYLARFERLGSLDDLNEAILAQRRAVDLMDNGHSSIPIALGNLGNALLRRYEAFSDIADIESAIIAQRQSVELTPDGHPKHAIRLGNLGMSLSIRYNRLEEIGDLEDAILTQHRAVELTADGHPIKPTLLSNLGNILRGRFERSGTLDDLKSALEVQQQSVALTADSHSEKPKYLSNLGNMLCAWFQRLRELDKLDSAISIHRRAIELTPDGHPDKPIRLSNLADAYCMRFQRLEEPEDSEAAVACQRCAADLTPDYHPAKTIRLNALGLILSVRYEHFGQLVDLEHAILSQRRVVQVTPVGHADQAIWLNNLGLSLHRRYKVLAELEDLNEAILLYRRASELLSHDHPHRPMCLSNKGIALHSRFERTKDLENLESAISALADGLELTPVEHPDRPIRLNNLGVSLKRRFELSQTKDEYDAAIECFMVATNQPLGSLTARLSSASALVVMFANYPEFSSGEELLLALSRIMANLSESVWFGFDIHRRFKESSERGWLVNTVVAVAISLGASEKAVEWLEEGRAFVWEHILSMRTPLDDLEKDHITLATALRGVRMRLQGIKDDNDVVGFMTSTTTERHRQLVLQYEYLLTEVRICAGFEDFMRPKRLSALLPSRERFTVMGPVVFINVDGQRCDALILLPDHSVTTVKLPALTQSRAMKLLAIWRDCLQTRGVRQRASLLPGHSSSPNTSRRMGLVLGSLWKWVVEPVLQALRFNVPGEDQDLPHLTWCPTGPLTQLPLHAAGVYSTAEGSRVYNFVVSSYTPSLSTLKRGCECVTQSRTGPSVLVVTQPDTPGQPPLPGTVVEGAHLRLLLSESQISVTVLNGDQATIESVRDIIDQHHWVHFACHGSQRSGDPTQSAFELCDGPLSLSALMTTVSERAELAFLSACQTAVGDEKIPEESAHLAAGMLAVGFKGVVATMWSIGDADAPIVADKYYKRLIEMRGAGVVKRGSTGAAYALHAAVRCLRESLGENNFVRWAPFVHFGL